MVGMNFPIIVQLLGAFAIGPPNGRLSGASLHFWRARICVRFLHIWLQIAGFTQLMMILWALGAMLGKDRRRSLVAVILTPIFVVVLLGIFFFPFRLTWALSSDDSLLVVMPVVAELFLVACFSYMRRLAMASLDKTAVESAQQLSARDTALASSHVLSSQEISPGETASTRSSSLESQESPTDAGAFDDLFSI